MLASFDFIYNTIISSVSNLVQIRKKYAIMIVIICLAPLCYWFTCSASNSASSSNVITSEKCAFNGKIYLLIVALQDTQIHILTM